MLHSGPQRITTRQPTRAFAQSEALVIEESDGVASTAASLCPIVKAMIHLLRLFLLAFFLHCPPGLATTVYKSTDEIKKRGGTILREAGPMNAGQTIISFVSDPDGYQIELIGKKS